MYQHTAIDVSLVFSCLAFRLGPSEEGKEGCAGQGGCASPRRRARVLKVSCPMIPHPRKSRLISWDSMNLVSDIKLIRTDTTLDLRRKGQDKYATLLSTSPSDTHNLTSFYIYMQSYIYLQSQTPHLLLSFANFANYDTSLTHYLNTSNTNSHMQARQFLKKWRLACSATIPVTDLHS